MQIFSNIVKSREVSFMQTKVISSTDFEVNFWQKCFYFLCASLMVSLLSGAAAQAEVKVSHLIADNMVLQADSNPQIYGTAKPTEKISVQFEKCIRTTTAGPDGKWSVSLGQLKRGQKGELKISAANTLTIKNVAVGEVWLCSGQSNMSFSLRESIDWQKFAKQKVNPDIRLFYVQPDMANQPMTDVDSSWRELKPGSMPEASAIAVMFAERLQQELKSPVGIIQTAYGGTPIKCFIPKEDLQQDQKVSTQLEVKPNSPAYFMQYAIDENFRKRRLSNNPLHPIPFTNLPQPIVPCTVYNAIIAPLVPYDIKGILWYQGEADAEQSAMYRKLFPMLIAAWRSKWHQPQLPFLYVQLPNFQADSYCHPTPDAWADFREAQKVGTAKPTAAMVVAIDLGESKNLHPRNKTILAQRLSESALDVVYKKAGLDSTSPELAKLTLDGSRLVCNFAHGTGLHATQGTARTFEICGADKKYVPANCAIKGSSAILSSKSVTHPLAMRYAWSNDPDCNLYNGAGLPVGPFKASLPGFH